MAFLAATVLGLSFVPLAGSIGYENGFVLSPIVSMLSVAVGVDAVRTARRDGASSMGALLTAAVTELAQLLGTALLALVVALAWQTNCDPWTGALFFLMGPALSGVAGLVAGLGGGLVAQRRGRQLAAGASVVVASTAIGAWRLIADPVIFAYDPFWGYFSGAIYDEDIGISGVYLAFRAYNLVAIGAALLLMSVAVDPSGMVRRSWSAMAAGGRKTWLRGSLALVLGAGAAAIGLSGARWGFTANLASITTVLSGTAETEHFVIHYSPRSADARTIDAIVLEHELAWSRLRRDMEGREPQQKVHSFVFASPGQKRTLMGAGTVQVAAPWRGQIYLDHRPFPHPVLHHELAHVFGATIGDDLFGVARSGLHLNIALIEGFATAMAPRTRDHLDLHDQALILERLDRRPSLVSIMGPSFFTQSSRVAYTTAGSFCAWLIATRGFTPMAALYRSAGDFPAAYGTPLATLETEWLAFLDARGGVTDDDVESQRQRFMRRSVFRRPCAHRAANIASEIRKADRQGQHEDAVTLYKTLCSIEPEDPAHLLGLAWAQGVTGDFGAATATLDEVTALDDLTVTIKAALASRRAEVALAAGDLPSAIQAEQEALTLPMARSKRRTHQLRLSAATDPSLTADIVAYLAPFDPYASGKIGAVQRLAAAVRIAALPGYRALGSYLMARQLLNVTDPEGAVPLLQVALSPEAGELPSDEFRRAAQLALLSASVQARQFDVARATVDALAKAPHSGHGDDQIVADWRERIEFFAQHSPAN